jgi:hypothetical protein
LAETRRSFVTGVSVTLTSVAVPGPPLATVSVYVNGLPNVVVCVLTRLLTVRSTVVGVAAGAIACATSPVVPAGLVTSGPYEAPLNVIW